ncbi:MAG: helix-turn-helix domain-containing protein [Candidatus Marinimicrobia bacterium]|nr:helix-turn-helix domain-containing protein [Candidatus Neomarinimicrobiota bacterium]MCF7880171.1 helix-turn-helix domain-containing protein [Candidatus Neomarinimicrobiota bacterium]
MATSNDIKTVFGQVLRTYRQNAGLSQEALAFECDLHRTFIGMLERGERRATIDTLFALASALDVSPHALIQDLEQRLSS